MNQMHSSSVLPTAEEKPVYVNHMFARIAATYDLMNRLMTFGQDQRWRRELIDLCQLPARGLLLDVGTGTGDIAYETMRLHPAVQAFGADFTYEMMAVGVGKANGRTAPFTQADACRLPYPDETFDAVVSGFLVRNVADRLAAFREMRRVTRPGGRVVCLETTPPDATLIGQVSQLYTTRVIPLLGRLISGDAAAYAYLPQSTVAFLTPAELRHVMEQAGLRGVFHRLRMMGAVAIHVGIR
jgi:demethylmenaquinone methyltransferase/2-methoxy-6-polyprenyl-1,4-benzoquinol methylase